MKRLIMGLLGLWALGAILPAAELDLSVSMENPLLVAGQRHVTYMKVGLKGFEWTRDRDRAPLNVSLVLDRSGSMEGDKLERAKDAARFAVDLLESRDILSIVTYESEVQVLVPATKVADKRGLYRAIDSIQSAGSTALFAGVSKGAAEVRKFLKADQVNRVILLSDGLANVGPDSPGELADLGASLRREGISVTSIGLGLDYNEDLMVRLAQSSDGNHAFVQEPKDLARIFHLEFKDAFSVVARDVDLKITCSQGIKPLRILGREGEIKGQEVSLNLNQVYSNQEKYFLIEVEVPELVPNIARSVADVAVRYQNLQTAKPAVLTAATTVKGTASQVEQEKNRVKAVVEAVAVQKNVEAGEEAIRLRDEGKLKEAKEVLEKSAAGLSALAKDLDSEALDDLSAAATENADKIEDEEVWQEQRKAMRSEQYSAANQQSY